MACQTGYLFSDGVEVSPPDTVQHPGVNTVNDQLSRFVPLLINLLCVWSAENSGIATDPTRLTPDKQNTVPYRSQSLLRAVESHNQNRISTDCHATSEESIRPIAIVICFA